MSATIDDNHPSVIAIMNDLQGRVERARLRDQIAMLALQGIIAESGAATRAENQLNDARNAYAYADAMLKAREGA